MKTLHCRPADLRASEVHIAPGAARRTVAEWCRAWFPERRLLALADPRVGAAWPELLGAGIETIETAGGEAAKTFDTLERVLRELARRGADRTSVLVVVGGGSLGDAGGMAASLFQRGITLVQVPTTLLAMVDSSVGGKTAINIPEGKNLVGSLWAADRVLIDPELLESLPEHEYRSGLGEVVKVAIGLHAGLFDALERRREPILARDSAVLADVVSMAVEAKIRVVEGDPRESGSRRLLNLGHTLGHAIEAASGYTVPHGIAVARGLHWAIDLAEARGRMEPAAANRARALLRAYGFERNPIADWNRLAEFVARDKKVERGRLHLVLPTGIGSSTTEATAVDQLRCP